MKIAHTLKNFRQIAQLTQSQVAEALHMERSTYSKLEEGKTALRMGLVTKLAQFYGVGVHHFTHCLTHSQLVLDDETKRLISIKFDIQ